MFSISLCFHLAIENQLVEVVRSCESDTTTGSGYVDANNLFHAYSSREGPVATPVDTSV